MNKYPINIRGDNTIEEIEVILNTEENTGAKFIELNITHHEGGDTNLATFEDLPGGQRPKTPLIFREGLAPGSDGIVPVWKGEVLTSNGRQKASAYR